MALELTNGDRQTERRVRKAVVGLREWVGRCSCTMATGKRKEGRKRKRKKKQSRRAALGERRARRKGLERDVR
jgi:hypothetical protein